MRDHDYPAFAVRDRAAAWAEADERVVVALVHGSVASGEVTELSDVDLVVATAPGMREAVWAERAELSQRLLGALVVEAHEVPHQRPYRWQARTASLCSLDLTVDDGAIEWWLGLAHDVDFLVDRADAASERAAWLAARAPDEYDVMGADDETWALISWVAGCLLHERTMLARLVLGDLIARRVAPVTGQPLYAISGGLQTRFEPAMPTSFDAIEVARALRAATNLYEELLVEWAAAKGTMVPQSAFRPAVLEVLDQLVAGGGTRLTSST